MALKPELTTVKRPVTQTYSGSPESARSIMDASGLILSTVEEQRLTHAAYYSVGALSVFIWDILYNLANDYDLIRTHGFDLASIVYLISRASTLGFVTVGTIILTAPLSNCVNFRVAGVTFFNIFTASTLLLSYIRVCAVWNRSTTIVILFGFLWLASLAGSLTTVSGITNFSIGEFCAERTAGDYVAAAVLGPTINHVIVFFAITYGLCRTRSQASILDLRRGYRLYILGDTLPAFSKALLQTSQLCYLVVVLIGVLTVGWFFGYSSDPGYRIAIFNPYAPIVNIMFSWVFRKAKLGVFTIIAPPNDATPNAIGLRGMRNTQSTAVLKPAVFRSTKDLESNMNNLNDELTSSSLRGYEYGDPAKEQYEYNIQAAVHASPAVKIGVEQVVELVSDTTSNGVGTRGSSGSPQYY